MLELVGAFHKAIGSRDSSVDTGLDDRAFIYRFPAVTTYFLFSKMSRATLVSTQPPVQWMLAVFPGGKAVAVG
jgi:hypothetical protein